MWLDSPSAATVTSFHHPRKTRMSTRRRFIAILPLAGVSVLAACGEKAGPAAAAPAPSPAVTLAPAAAATPTPTTNTAAGPLVDQADPAAVALGYVADAGTTKDPKHTAGAVCGNCALFGGKSGDAIGPCPLFAGKQVSTQAWCTAYAKKS